MKKYYQNIIKLIGGILFILLNSSCRKLIEIPPNPPSEIAESGQFADSSTAMTAVAGVYVYTAGTGSGFPYDDALLTRCAGLSSDELSYTGTSADLQAFYSYGLTSINGNINTLWSTVYKNIYPVNAILQNVTSNNNLSSSFRKQIVGEMKVVRALYYFNLVNLFGAVPLVTSTDYNNTAHIARTSVDSIYAQIVSDLSDAGSDLTAAYPSAGRARPNLYTALTFLAKVHLFRGQWQDAYNEADSVIKSGIYTLNPDPSKVFLDGSQEAIWQLPATGPYEVTADANFFVPSTTGTTPVYILSPSLLSAFEAGDQRLQKWVGTVTVNVGGNSHNYSYPYKYKNRLTSATPVEDYMIFRLAEVYLLRAEAAVHIGKNEDALTDLNRVRVRAGLPESIADPSSQNDVQNAIAHERQTELFCEWGNRWFDLKRTATADAVLGTEKTGWQANAALYPLPQTQLQLDNLLIQNIGY